jgi:hypothetical protein
MSEAMHSQISDINALFAPAKATGESIISPYATDLVEVSNHFKCSLERIQRQFLLHAPYFEESTILTGVAFSKSSKMHDILQSRISNYNLAESSYRDSIGIQHLNLCDNLINTDCDDVIFKDVTYQAAEVIEGRLHYLQFFRKDSSFRFGLFVKDADFPFAYASFSLCDRSYLASAINSFLNFEVNVGAILNICRIFVADGAPKYSVSRLLSLSIKELTRRKFDLFITAVNPYLLFNGHAIKSSSFSVFASSPVSYNYNGLGIYTPRRSRRDISQSKWSPPDNFIFMKSPIKKIKTSIYKSDKIVEIPNEHHSNIVNVPNPGSSKARLQHDIGSIRGQLELVWDEETRYHKTPFNPGRDNASKGQCGVSSAFLAQRLKEAGYNVQFCEGDVYFVGDKPIKEHCWLVLPGYVSVPSGGTGDLVIDITPDQSGFSKSVICDSYENLEARGISYRESRRLPPNQIGVAHLWSRLDILKDRLNHIGGDQN